MSTYFKARLTIVLGVLAVLGIVQLTEGVLHLGLEAFFAQFFGREGGVLALWFFWILVLGLGMSLLSLLKPRSP